MRNVLLTFSLLLSIVWTAGAVHASPKVQTDNATGKVVLKDVLKGMELNEILEMSPKKYREKTGKRLGLMNSVKLKVAQKMISKSQGKASDIPKGIYILGAFLGIAWIFMGIMDDFEGNNWWISLLLYALFYIPGLIYALIKMGDYY